MAQLKKPTTCQEQIEILKSRNIIIDSASECETILQSVNYYRLTAYLVPFKKKDGTYYSGIHFRRIYRIYEFDRKLRGILLAALEEVEIYLRTKISYFHAHKYGSEGYMHSENYCSSHDANKFKESLEREIISNKRAAFVIHHNKYYDGHFPIWAIIELFTFGMLSRFYSDMKTVDKKILAKELYGTIPKNIISWLHCCADLRNVCAHYGRLYYRIFPSTPANIDASYPEIHQLWGAMLALKALYPYAEKWNAEILPQFIALFEQYHEDIALRHIGFPTDWAFKIKK